MKTKTKLKLKIFQNLQLKLKISQNENHTDVRDRILPYLIADIVARAYPSVQAADAPMAHTSTPVTPVINQSVGWHYFCKAHSHRASLLFVHYQIILLNDTGKCVFEQHIQSCYLKEERSNYVVAAIPATVLFSFKSRFREVTRWALRKAAVEVDEWLVKAVMAMYEGAQTVVRTTEGDSKAFNVKVGLHQGSVLSPLLFVIVMEMIFREL